MSVMDFFRSQPAAAPATQQPQQQPNQQQQQQNQPQANAQGVQGPASHPNPSQPGNTQNPAAQQAANPLDQFSKMWDNPTQGAEDKAPAFQIAPDVLKNVASQQDFTRGIDPALMQKAMSGDAQSMIDMMNAVGRNAYQSSLEHSSTLTDKFVSAREGFNEKSFSKKVRGELTTQALSSTPNFSHPVVRKQLTDVASKLQQQHPDAQPQEIADMAKQYLTELASALNPAKTDPTSNPDGTKKAVDWDNFFDEPSNS